MIWILWWWTWCLWSLSNKKWQVLMLFSFNVCFLWWSIAIKNLCLLISFSFFMFLCVLIVRQFSRLLRKRFFTPFYVLLLLGGARIWLLSNYLSFGPTQSKWLIIGEVCRNGKDHPQKVMKYFSLLSMITWIQLNCKFLIFIASLFEPFFTKLSMWQPNASIFTW